MSKFNGAPLSQNEVIPKTPKTGQEFAVCKTTNSVITITMREADFDDHPTELFRLINYRRWHNAVQRARIHPEEVRTWIVSRARTTKEVAWKRLPIHLCCMQPTIPNSFLDVLLMISPESAGCKDHSGMTPLHLSCIAGGITARIAGMLLVHNPSAVLMKDESGRDPITILESDITNGGNGGSNKAMKIDALHVLINMRTHLKQQHGASRSKEINKSAVESFETAKQIRSLEMELAKCREQLNLLKSGDGEETDRVDRERFETMKDLLKKQKKEVDNLSARNEELQGLAKEHRERGDSCALRLSSTLEQVASLTEQLQQLEIEKCQSTAHSKDLEARLQEIEIDLEKPNNQVLCLQEVGEFNPEQDDLGQEVEFVASENSRLKDTVQELAKMNLELQDQIRNASDSWRNLLESKTVLVSEQEQLLKGARQKEINLLEFIQSERKQYIELYEKQRKHMEMVHWDHLRIVESSERTQNLLEQTIHDESGRMFRAVEEVKNAVRSVVRSQGTTAIDKYAGCSNSIKLPASPILSAQCAELVHTNLKSTTVQEQKADQGASFWEMSPSSAVEVLKKSCLSALGKHDDENRSPLPHQRIIEDIRQTNTYCSDDASSCISSWYEGSQSNSSRRSLGETVASAAASKLPAILENSKLDTIIEPGAEISFSARKLKKTMSSENSNQFITLEELARLLMKGEEI